MANADRGFASLNGMVGFATLIAERAGREDHADSVLKYAQRIQRSGARMDRLIGDLRDVVSIQTGDPDRA
jgi:signal transduction histidine kinase